MSSTHLVASVESMTQKSKDNTSRSVWSLVWEAVLIIGLAFALLVGTQAFIGRPYVIPSASMEPTLHGCEGCTNDRIIVEKLSYYFSDPNPGDVVVFEGPDAWNVGFTVDRSNNVMVRGVQNLVAAAGLRPNTKNILVKRVIATEGDTVQCREGDPGVMVNGTKTNDSFIKSPPDMENPSTVGSDECGGKYFGPLTVPEGNLFVMGDNRTNSLDSRYHLGDQLQGTIPVSHVKGRVRAVFYPSFHSVGSETV